MADTSLAGRRVLVVANEQVGVRMAGPAIRARQIARFLHAQGAQVTLAMPQLPDVADSGLAGVELRAFGTPSARGFRALAAAHDVVVTQPQRVDVAWGLRRARVPVIYDLYVPSFVERIAQLGSEPMNAKLKRRLLERDRMEYAAALELGAAFVCASQTQKDHWLGALGHGGRLDVDLLARDPRGDQLVGVVPFGVTDTAPPELDGRGAIKGTLVPDDSIVLLWTGGLWNWFDPVTVVEALARARETDARLRLVVMGTKHPEAHWEEQDAARRMRERAKQLGLLENGGVVLCDSWVPYAERHRYLLDADLGVSAHHDSLETRLSFRTRFLDHLWTGLPTLTTAGGELVDRMEAAGAARTLAEGDVDAWAQLFVELARDEDERERMRASAQHLAETYRWHRVLAPLTAMVERLTRPQAASVPKQRAHRVDAIKYASLLIRVRIQAKGVGSLGSAVIAAGRRSG